MKVYQQISGYNKSIIDLTIVCQESNSLFSVAGGSGSIVDDNVVLHQTGFVFSGINGFLFDQSGNFFGGYSPQISFNINVHLKEDGSFSYFYNDQLVSNNMQYTTGMNYIEFEKNNSSLLLVVRGDADGKISY